MLVVAMTKSSRLGLKVLMLMLWPMFLVCCVFVLIDRILMFQSGSRLIVIRVKEIGC